MSVPKAGWTWVVKLANFTGSISPALMWSFNEAHSLWASHWEGSQRLPFARLVPQLGGAGSRVTPCIPPSGLSLANLGQESRGEPTGGGGGVGWTVDCGLGSLFLDLGSKSQVSPVGSKGLSWAQPTGIHIESPLGVNNTFLGSVSRSSL